MDLFDAKMKLITLKERIIDEYARNLLMNRRIANILRDDITSEEKTERIAKLIKDNKYFQPSIMTATIGDYELEQTSVSVPQNPKDTVSHFHDYLEMKKQGLENFESDKIIIGRNGNFQRYKNSENEDEFYLTRDFSYYQKKYDEYYIKPTSNIPYEIDENSTCKILSYSNGSSVYVYRFSPELVDKRVHQYASAFVRRLTFEQQDQNKKIKIS